MALSDRAVIRTAYLALINAGWSVVETRGTGPAQGCIQLDCTRGDQHARFGYQPALACWTAARGQLAGLNEGKAMKYTKEMAQRDQNAHKAARAAAWLWSADYASTGLGLMGYWDTLSNSAKNTARRCVADIEKARPETLNARHKARAVASRF